ncbi:MAG: cell surface protein [Euryarchaeota archaeon]|jgi:hypothetical protein|uniref:cell surface protein n=1 Tax=Methanobacterium sp. MZD130B TaxID=3394378 RepID=UPI0039FD131E|nr:cell surface protein [Euryarchaeota archaeon]
MESKLKLLSLKILLVVLILFLNICCVSAAQWEVGVGQTYNNIQTAIDNVNTVDGDVINVHSGVYFEDVTVNKKLTLKAHSGDNVHLQPVNTGFTVVSGGSGSSIDGFHLDNSPQGTGINISANGCTVKNNNINGGSTGIRVYGANTTIFSNALSGQSKIGIMANLTGGFFDISKNSVTNIKGLGTLNGILISTNGSVTNVNIIKNTFSQINALGINSSVFVIQLGKSKGADGNPEVADIANLKVTKNLIIDINAASAIMGMEIVTSSVDALISENKISNLIGTLGSSVYALEAAIVGNGIVLVSKNNISGISASEQAVGIVTVALGDLVLMDNQVSNINKANASAGIIGLGLLNNAKLKNNIVFDITSPSIAAGIVGTAMSHLDVLFNDVKRVVGANDVSLVTAGFNTTTVQGNNIEGDGSGIGIVICSPNGMINYNRIVNYDFYIQNFLFSSFGPTIDEMLKPIDDAIKKNPELEPILKPIRDELDKLFHELENSKTTASFNWYGNNNPDSGKFFIGNGTLIYSPWLILTIKAIPSTIYQGQHSMITADVYTDVAGGYHRADADMYFSGSSVTFTTNLGSVGSKTVLVPWLKGLAKAILRADEGPGIATITASDYETVKCFVTILGASVTPTSLYTVPMQETGTPLEGLALALLILFNGFICTIKNNK